MRKTIGGWTSVAGALALALGACASLPPAEARRGTTMDPALAAATFDTAWSVIHRTHYDSTFGGLNWHAVRAELLPRAYSAATEDELRAVIRGMLGRLEQSHFVLIPRDVDRALSEPGGRRDGPSGHAGLEIRLAEGRFLVTRVDEDGPAARAGVRPGWLLERAGSVRAAEALERLASLPAADGRNTELYAWALVAGALSGTAGDPLEGEFVDGDGRVVRRDLVLAPPPGQVTRFGNLPEMVARLERERVRAPGGADVGVLRFNVWMPVLAAELETAVDALREADGMVVDLRGNVGGLAFMAAGTAGHFMETPDTIGTMLTRNERLRFVVAPRRSMPDGRVVRPFGGPLAVLVDGASASTSEFFAGGLQAIGRARVFGTPSAGQALPAHTRRLPNGDVLMHAIADFVGPGGVRWEGAGVVPDEEVPLTREALLAGRDPALEAALRWIDAAVAGAVRH